jgi:hypothetical protein
MPMASANATPRIMFVWMAARASGLRPERFHRLAYQHADGESRANAPNRHRDGCADRLCAVGLKNDQKRQNTQKVHDSLASVAPFRGAI